MKIVSSYAVEIKHANKVFNETLTIYRRAVTFLVKCYELEYNNLNVEENSLQRFKLAERLIHNTKNNVAKYNFDDCFYKMPTYLRRSAINTALGILDSYHSNYDNWLLTNQKTKAPRLQVKHLTMPTFYNDNMYKEGDEPNTAYLKIFQNNDWVWLKISLKNTDVNYIKKYWNHVKASAPILEKRFGKYYLRFCFEENVKLNQTSIDKQKVCAVDLGINTDATCCIMNKEGAIIARQFINFSIEKDHLYTVLNRIKKQSRRYSPRTTSSLWSYAKRLNDELAYKIANNIVSFAVLHNADVIVFEHLDIKGKKKGSKKQKLHMWKKNTIQSRAEHQAHRYGMRVSHICAKYTSALAYDGSGEVERNNNNYSLCLFKTGKQYNCDLNASYNIGARYFIKAILKPLSETKRSSLEAKVPSMVRRTTCTLNTLKQLNAVM